jgi:hypothetical protein
MSVFRVAPHVILIFALLSAFRVNAQTPSQDASGLPPTQYETAGPFRIARRMSSTQVDEIETQIRSFLWHHLAAKIPGKLDLTYYTLEGEPSQYLFFVEANSQGDWAIRAKVTAWRSNHGYPNTAPETTVAEEKYCRVERIDSVDSKAIPAAEPRNPKSYRLVLKTCSDRAMYF